MHRASVRKETGGRIGKEDLKLLVTIKVCGVLTSASNVLSCTHRDSSILKSLILLTDSLRGVGERRLDFSFICAVEIAK